LDGEAGYFCAAFHEALVDLESPGAASAEDRVAGRGGVKDHSAECNNGEMQKAVPVKPCEFVQPPQRVLGESVASLVRLQPLDFCLRTWSQAADALLSTRTKTSGSRSGTSLPIHVPENRERQLIRDLLGQRIGIGTSQIKDQEVETRTQIVQTIPDDAREGRGAGGVDFLYQHDVLAAFALEVVDNEITISLSPTRNLTFEFLQVVKRPHEG
jgi:hypothetical protein